jgi:hypothetical protein
MQRGIGNLLLMKEGNYGRSHITCLQDTLVALVPKAMVSRSKAELSEVGFLEILESALIYYSVPLLGGPGFKKLFGSFLPKKNRALLTEPLHELEKQVTSGKLLKDEFHHVLAAKGAIIATGLTLTGIGGEYIINYLRNLLTFRVFNMDKFSDVVNLSHGENKTGQKSSVVEKSWHRIQQVLGVCTGILGASLIGARFGPKLFSEKFINGPIKSFINTFDFQFANGAYGLTKNQMGAYMALSVPAYLDSARDNLEKWESATRLGVVLPYLLWGQDWLESFFRENYSSIVETMDNGVNRVKSLEELAHAAIRDTLKEKGIYNSNSPGLKPLNTNELSPDILQAAAEKLKEPLQAKTKHVGIPLAVGVLGTGIGIGLMNRYFTQRRFEKQAMEQQSKRSHTFIAPPLGNTLPLPQQAWKSSSVTAQRFPQTPSKSTLPRTFLASSTAQPMFQQLVPARPTPQPSKPWPQSPNGYPSPSSNPPLPQSMLTTTPFAYPTFKMMGNMPVAPPNGIQIG